MTNNSPVLHITVGIPGSGKSTWARQWLAQAHESRVRINRDDTRTFLGLGHGDNEPLVSKVQKAAVRAALSEGKDVVVDDTNLVAKFAKEWLKVAAEFNAIVEWHEEFLAVDVRTCIDRDRNREAKVGQDVIMKMAQRAKSWKRPVLNDGPNLSGFAKYEGTPGKPDAFLVDIDGTIASNGPLDRSAPHRGYYAWKLVGKDSPIEAIIEIVQALQAQGMEPIYVSGRDAICYPETHAWISEYVDGLNDFKLYMRPEGDMRKDSIVKLEIFDQYIRDNYNVKFCLDDRNQVVEAYRGIGLPVLQCADGEF